jgi:acyl-CoA dehydrogenase
LFQKGDFMLGKIALKQFKAMNNAISETQRAALESGTVGWEASIFKGKPNWKELFDMAPPSLTPEEQSFLDNETNELCGLIDDWKIRDELKDLQPEVWEYLKKNRFFGMIIPRDYGGLGFSAYAHSQIVSKIASRSGTVAATVMVPNSLGPGELLLRYGTDEQKNHYLPRLADGREVPCFALTSEQAGSDATNQKDEGILFKDTDGSLKIRLNWDKRYTTLAPVATIFGLAFQLKDPDALLGKGANVGITLALIPAGTPGMVSGNRHRPMGTPFQNGPHWGHNVIIPAESIIGGTAYAGSGWNMLVDCLSVGRSISLPASATGAAKWACRVTGAYAFVRQQFNLPVARMEGVQEALARIGGLTYLIDSARIRALQDLDTAHHAGRDARPAVSSAILKYHTTEMARRIAIDAMDVHGGKAVCEGPNNPIGPMFQGVPVGITVEGANIMTRSLMIFGQGAFLAHPYVLDEMRAAKNNDAKAAGDLALKHVLNLLGNKCRAFAMGLTNGAWSSAPRSGPDAVFYRRINRLAAAFSYTANLTMILLQSRLMKLERASALLGDALSHLYMAGQVLRRFDYDGRMPEDVPLMQWAASYGIFKAEDALYEMVNNHPSTLAKWLIKPVVFPFGRRNHGPSHRLDAKISELLSTPCAARDHLTANIYVPTGEKEYLVRLERAFLLCHQAWPHEQTLFRAVKKGQLSQTENYERMVEEAAGKNVIDAATKALLLETYKARTDIIDVDHFPHEWHGKPVNPSEVRAGFGTSP